MNKKTLERMFLKGMLRREGRSTSNRKLSLIESGAMSEIDWDVE